MSLSRRGFLACVIGAVSAESLEISDLERRIYLNDIKIQNALASVGQRAKRTDAMLRDFGSGNLAAIHGKEAVIPLQTAIDRLNKLANDLQEYQTPYGTVLADSAWAEKYLGIRANPHG